MLKLITTLTSKISPNLRQIISNASWLVADKVLRMAVALVVGVWIARYLGPEQFGLLNYAIAFAALFYPIASLGLDSIVVREIVQHPNRKERLLGTAFYLKLLGGLAATLLTTIGIYFFRADALSRLLVLTLAISFAFQAFEVVDLWFQSQVQSKNTVLAKNLAFAIVTALKIGCIQVRAPLQVFAYLYLIEIVVGAVGLLITYRAQNQSFDRWRISRNLIRQLLRDGYPLIFSGMAVIIYMKVDQIMIGQMLGDKFVGIYSAAARISEVWYFIPAAIASSVSPEIIKAKDVDSQQYYKKLQIVFDLMVLISVFISITMSFLAKPLILTLYGAEYSEAIPILVTHIWSSIFIFLGSARGIWLNAENLLVFSLKTTVIGAIINVVLNLFLIPKYAGLGAAIATVIAYSCAVLFSCIFYPKLWTVGQLMLRALVMQSLLSQLKMRITK
jgi:polysaccharide transporter, PST family